MYVLYTVVILNYIFVYLMAFGVAIKYGGGGGGRLNGGCDCEVAYRRKPQVAAAFISVIFSSLLEKLFRTQKFH